MLALMLVVVFFGTHALSRLFLEDRPDLAISLSPALLIIVWTFVIAGVVSHGVALNVLWTLFWSATLLAATGGLLLAFRDRRRIDRFDFLLPTIATAIVMAPYLIRGLAAFPGSWFWDGFAYMAAGESLWLYPRRANIPGLELFYQFGHLAAQDRYISSSLISMMRGVFPLGGDAQAATGYFLFLCILTLSSSCYFLAKVAISDRKILQIAFVVIATISGPILNLVWTNNFDHLLAMSVAPGIIAIALFLRWGRKPDAVLLGAFIAVQVYIYPEMAPLFVMPAAVILAVRLVHERQPAGQVSSVAVCLVTLLVILLPAWSDTSVLLEKRFDLVANASSAVARPGNGYFPTFLLFFAVPERGSDCLNLTRCAHSRRTI
jgi:hypothetical protein